MMNSPRAGAKLRPMPEPHVVETGRLLLRPWGEDDEAELVRLFTIPPSGAGAPCRMTVSSRSLMGRIVAYSVRGGMWQAA